MINAGDLRDEAIIQRPVRTEDADGGSVISSWSDVETVRCMVRADSVSEKIVNQKAVHVGEFTVTMRFTKNLRPDFRLLVNGTHKFQVAGIDDVKNLHIRLDVKCFEEAGVLGLLYEELSEDEYNGLTEEQCNSL